MIIVSIVEDDDQAAYTLAKQLTDFSQAEGVYFDIKRYNNGIAFLENYNPADLVFMDIDMPHMDGITVAEKLRKIDNRTVLIFVTNMAQYAVKGYSVNALDFIVKPIIYSDFSFKLKRAIHAINAIKDDDVLIPLKDGLRRFKSGEIIYIEIHGHTLTYHLENDSFSVRGTLNETNSMFPSFLRCNSCYLVNPKHVDWVKGYEVKVGNDILAISRPKKKEFINALSTWYSKGGL